MAKYVELVVFIGNRTDKAVELTFFPDTEEEQAVWVPLSVIEDPSVLDGDTDENGNAEVSIAKWFLKKSDIDYASWAAEPVQDTYDRFMDLPDEDDDDLALRYGKD